jgi:heterotetrameric sarcosine oxidase delta subunit
MAFLIRCPRCGPRPVTEFAYGGEVPETPASIDADARVVDRAWMHANAAGPCRERWFHDAGCHRWLTVVRDTRTNEILEPPPA